jgi:probable F420-dependent oxidoreductase
MKVGISLPCGGGIVSADAIYESARLAEDLGLDSLWTTDRLLGPLDLKTAYPYTQDGRMLRDPSQARLDPFVTLGVVAGATRRVALGTGVANIPYRDPLTTAKMVATLDVLSRGRAILGAGTGWMAEEFDALNVPYSQRGARTDEYLAIMKVLWTEKTPHYAGRFYRFGEVKFEPKPVQQPHPPVWIGGHTDVAIRRALRVGDGWHPTRLSPAAFAERLAVLRRLAGEMGRDVGELTISAKVGLNLCPSADVAREYQRLGVQHLVIDFWSEDLDTLRREIELVGTRIAPAVR